MNEKKIVLTEEQFDEALRFAAMGGAGLLSPSDITSTLEKLPEEIRKKALSSALAAGCIRAEGPIGAFAKVLKMVAEGRKDKE